MSRLLFVWGLTLWIAPSWPAAAGSFNPYAVPREQVQARVHTIALNRVVLPPGTADADAVRDRFESLIMARLQAQGFKTVPAAAYEEVWGAMSARVGGVFNPVTGRADEKKFETVREHTARELEHRHGADAILDAFVTVGYALPGTTFGLPMGHYALWGQAIPWQGKPIPEPPVNRPQQVRATYLDVILRDLAGTKLYGIRLGIEWVRVYVARSYEDRPPAELYALDRCKKSVDGALDMLVATGTHP